MPYVSARAGLGHLATGEENRATLKIVSVEEYRGLLEIAGEWDKEFARHKLKYGERIQCRKGCSACCSQMFHITEPEAAYVSRAVKSMPQERRKRMRERASRYLRDRAELLASRNVPDAWGSLPEPGLRLQCPALEAGVCAIYANRPLICHKYGIPLYNPRKPERLFACELNFKPGEEIDDRDLVQIQTGIDQRWRGLQSRYNEQGGRRDDRPLTVARAILEDFESYLPGSPETR